MHFKQLVLVTLIGVAASQRPVNESICDFYTTALLKTNSPANQYTLLTLLVNTAVIGNYTKPNVGVSVPGLLTSGTYNGQTVDLLPYFDGGLASTNPFNAEGKAKAVNFLDGGGAAPLLKNMPSNSNTTAQYFLLTHLYQYFGVLLGCSGAGTPDFPAYMGRGSMYTVHRFMDLSAAEVGYFITQVGLAAASFGVAAADTTVVAKALASTFDVRCAPPATVIPAFGPQLQSICIQDDCPLAANYTCKAYQPAVVPLVANATLAMGQGRHASSSWSSVSPSSASTSSSASTKASSASAIVFSSSSSAMETGSATTTGVGVATYMPNSTTAGVAAFSGAAAGRGAAAFGIFLGAAVAGFAM